MVRFALLVCMILIIYLTIREKPNMITKYRRKAWAKVTKLHERRGYIYYHDYYYTKITTYNIKAVSLGRELFSLDSVLINIRSKRDYKRFIREIKYKNPPMSNDDFFSIMKCSGYYKRIDQYNYIVTLVHMNGTSSANIYTGSYFDERTFSSEVTDNVKMSLENITMFERRCIL